MNPEGKNKCAVSKTVNSGGADGQKGLKCQDS